MATQRTLSAVGAEKTIVPGKPESASVQKAAK